MKTVNLLMVRAFFLQTEISNFAKFPGHRSNGDLRALAVFQALKEGGEINRGTGRSPGRLDKSVTQLPIAGGNQPSMECFAS